MNCPHCKANEQWLHEKKYLEFDKDEVKNNPLVLNDGSLIDVCKYWFAITEHKCCQCGGSFWLQDHTK
jgi:hypothetical protein